MIILLNLGFKGGNELSKSGWLHCMCFRTCVQFINLVFYLLYSLFTMLLHCTVVNAVSFAKLNIICFLIRNCLKKKEQNISYARFILFIRFFYNFSLFILQLFKNTIHNVVNTQYYYYSKREQRRQKQLNNNSLTTEGSQFLYKKTSYI